MLWKYYPSMFEDVDLDELLEKVESLVEDNIVGRYKIERKSCKIVGERIDDVVFSYRNFAVYNWSVSRIIRRIKRKIEKELNLRPFDYCLVHLYKDGNSSIAWHNDNEALDSEVVSVSFGATRKFRFRKIGTTKGWKKEFLLGHGDVLLMKVGCQSKYQHTVPKEKRITEPRINLTFRYY